jgi:hypothetical protein
MPGLRSTLVVWFVLVIAGLAAAPCPAQTKRPSREDIQYGPHKRHKFIIWHAKGTGPRPVLVYFFGGAFAFGSPSGGPLKGDMLKNGVTVVGGGYRFRQDGASKREILEDGARVIQYLRANAARFNIDPARIGVSGFSSGGVVASWIALHNDLRRPGSPDPVLRQSSRVSVCCLQGSQVHPLDLESWARYTGSDRTLLRLGIFNFVLLRLDGSMFRDPINRDDYATDEEYEQAKLAYRNDTFGFYQCSADDPPMCFHETNPDDPNRYVKKNNNGGGLHSPLLMIPMERRLKELDVPVLWGKKELCRDFILAELKK